MGVGVATPVKMCRRDNLVLAPMKVLYLVHLNQFPYINHLVRGTLSTNIRIN